MSAKATLRKVISKSEFVTDSLGRRRKVILDLATYRELLEELELKQDAEDLDKAIAKAKPEDFVDYMEVRKELKRQGKL